MEDNKEYKVGYCKPPEETKFKKGNPGGPGRPPVKLFRDLIKEFYAANPEKKQEIIENLDKLASEKGYTSQKLRAIEFAVLQHDGPQPTEINIKGIIVNVGNEYAQLGIEANRRDLEERKQLT